MAAINPPAEWSTDQALLPESPVDYFYFNSHLIKGIPISTAEGSIWQLDLLSPGSGYTNGSYNGVELRDTGTATGLFATIDIQWLAGSIAFVIVQNPGQAYKVGDQVTVDSADVGGTGSGLLFVVSAVSPDPDFTKAAPALKVAPLPAPAPAGIDLSGSQDLMKLSVSGLKDLAARHGIDVSGLPDNDKQLLADYIAANLNLNKGG